jgi:hypothetical protein
MNTVEVSRRLLKNAVQRGIDTVEGLYYDAEHARR